jgi:hypothetical protein
LISVPRSAKFISKNLEYRDYGGYFTCFGVFDCDFISPDNIKC